MIEPGVNGMTEQARAPMTEVGAGAAPAAHHAARRPSTRRALPIRAELMRQLKRRRTQGIFIVLLLLVIVCAEVSLVLTYMHLCVEDWKWWWKSFFSSGSVAIYIFLYSINYLVFDLKSLSGPVSATLYIGYSLFMVIAIMLATGTVGFISSFCFVHYLFSSVKAD